MEPGKGWGEEWKPIEAFCSQWAEHIRTVRAFAERHPFSLMTIRLEDLAADPEGQMDRVREFVGPSWTSGISAPVQHSIIQPFETWKRDALQPADPKIAERAGKSGLDAYETWRVKSLLRIEMNTFGYDTAAEAPPLDDLHRRLVASLDWYRDAMARRDELMDVKTTRIRTLLNEAAERTGVPAPRRRGAGDSQARGKAAARARQKSDEGAAAEGKKAKSKVVRIGPKPEADE
jgi:hypothetical protein